jgi:hypothetical protein
MTKIHSKNLKFANSKLSHLDFEIKRRPLLHFAGGILLIFLILPIPLISAPLFVLGILAMTGLAKMLSLFIPIIAVNLIIRLSKKTTVKWMQELTAPL